MISRLAAALLLLAHFSAFGEPPQGRRETIEAMLLGTAAGDAFGAGFEGLGRDWIFEHVDFTKWVKEKHGKYALGHRIGDYSDDTSDTIAVMRAMTAASPFTTDTLLEEIRREYEGSKPERGGVPRAGFGSVQRLFEGEITLDTLRDYQRKKAHPGNAPPMRALPIGLIEDESKIDAYAVINADVTHPHPQARASSILVARAARYLLVEKKDPAKIIEALRPFVKDVDAETFHYLAEVDKLGPTLSEADYVTLLGPQPIKTYLDGSPIKGLLSDAMRTAGAALYIAKYAKDPFDALKRSIHMGGDVDSVAAITVGLLAGKHGLSSLPPFLLEGLEKREELRRTAHDFAAAKPGCAAVAKLAP